HATLFRAEPPTLSKRQQEICAILEEWRELPLKELLRLAGTTTETVRRLEDKGLLTITSEVSSRDPYAAEHILPTEPLPLNPDQARALEQIVGALDELRTATGATAAAPETSTGASQADGRGKANPAVDQQPALRQPPVFLLHGVTGSGKTEVYLQAIAHALSHGYSAIV